MVSKREGLGLDHIDRLPGSAETKRRLKVFLQTLSGELTAAEGQAQLGLGESQFHKLRRKALEGALKGLEPGKAGRPAKASLEARERESGLSEELEVTRRELVKAKLELGLAELEVEALEEGSARRVVPPAPVKKKPRHKSLLSWKTRRRGSGGA